ncbi:RCC1/BLIP-II protein [Calocera viscosa TUFC12733]|uniref:RCC1/BLIP-II protein n=1 Tax=Calocera viscosa (strain TUFC12733) TaxID=1330018 RepID=A0A167S5Z8_CALVF|nr:RCC1/BLIP-II protein [Calocera viscosa TUFC12733]
MSTASLSSLPVEVLIDNLLDFLPLADLAHLSATNRFFHALCNDDILWKRKLIEDFNYPRVLDARTSGFKPLYKGMKQPKVYAWGSVDNGRLGLSSPELNRSVVRAYGGVPQPVELELFSEKGIQIVQLSAGGWSFNALDSTGALWVWGQLNAETFAFNGDPFSHPGRRAVVPHRITFPDNVKFRSVSSGRNHVSALDSRTNVWTFRSWGRPYRLVSPNLSGVEQIACGWNFTAALTSSGEVYVWWPGSGEFAHVSDDHDAVGGPQRQPGREREGIIESVGWEMSADPLELPGLGSLDDPRGQTATEKLRIVQIACGTDFVVALTNANQVLKIELGGGDADDGFQVLRQSFRTGRRWEYLPLFSEAKRVAMLPAFQSATTPVPDDMRITHVSAQFNTFVAYSTGSSSIVLMGTSSTQPDMSPSVVPALQHRSVISVVLGDYHRAALTAQGELLTWGSFSSGALGLGDPYKLEPGTPGGFRTIRDRDWGQRSRQPPPDVEEPTPVNFHFGQEDASPTFCFSAAAAGWHVGALVLDLEEQREPPRVTVGSSSTVEGAEPPLEHDPEDPSMPGSFTRTGSAAGTRVRGLPPYTGARIGQHVADGRFEPQEPDLTRAMGLYGIRLGYPARGVLRSAHPRGS